MRIIAGKYRGRRLQAPRGRLIRPTSDRLRESIFNIVGDAIAGHNALDVFAGTGALGIEALSRGAEHVVFLDNHPQALQYVRSNLQPLEIQRQWYAIRWDAGKNLHCLSALKLRFGYAFLDPPYDRGLAQKALENLIDAEVMHPDGLIIIEHHQREGINWPECVSLWDQRRYGKTLVTFLRPMV